MKQMTGGTCKPHTNTYRSSRQVLNGSPVSSMHLKHLMVAAGIARTTPLSNRRRQGGSVGPDGGRVLQELLVHGLREPGPFKGLHTVTATVNGATTASVNFTATAAPDAPGGRKKKREKKKKRR